MYKPIEKKNLPQSGQNLLFPVSRPKKRISLTRMIGVTYLKIATWYKWEARGLFLLIAPLLVS